MSAEHLSQQHSVGLKFIDHLSQFLCQHEIFFLIQRVFSDLEIAARIFFARNRMQKRKRIIAEIFVFDNTIENIQPEAVDAFLQPEPAGIEHFFFHFRIAVIQIRLKRQKEA